MLPIAPQTRRRHLHSSEALDGATNLTDMTCFWPLFRRLMCPPARINIIRGLLDRLWLRWPLKIDIGAPYVQLPAPCGSSSGANIDTIIDNQHDYQSL